MDLTEFKGELRDARAVALLGRHNTGMVTAVTKAGTNAFRLLPGKIRFCCNHYRLRLKRRSAGRPGRPFDLVFSQAWYGCLKGIIWAENVCEYCWPNLAGQLISCA